MGTFEIVIEPKKKLKHYWSDLWKYRELFFFFSWRDILVRYKQTVIGIAWSVIRPMLTTVVLTFVFSKVAKLPSDGIPYPILVFAAQLPWQFFSNSFTESSNSLISNANILTKVYFPRIIIPTSSVIVSLIDFLVSAAIMAGMMVFYRFVPGAQLAALPLFLLLAFFLSMGGGLWVATLNVKYRDFRYIVPFIVQFGMYLSPVGFSSATIPADWRLLYSLNPMVGIIDGFRWAIYGGKAQLYLPSVWISIAVTATVFLTGLWYFRKMEATFADVI